MGQIRRPSFTVQVTDPLTGEVRRERRESKVWWIRYYRAGKRHEESSGSTKKMVAIELLKKREGAVAAGVPVSAQHGRLRVEEAFAGVVRDYKVNDKRTTAQVERRIRLHLEPFFGGRKMASITTADVQAYQESRQEGGASNSTINNEVAILKRAFRLAEQGGTVLHRPHIPMLALNNVREGFFERSDFESVREHLPGHLRGVATFAYWTGWRVPSEVLTLEWKQVDRREKVIRLEPGTTKNKRARTLPYGLLPELVEVVEAAWSEHRRLAGQGIVSPYLFPHRDGRPIRDYRKAWATACEAAGVPGRLVHDFRRTAVRNLVRAGVSQKVAMEVSGHLTPSVFARYDIVVEEDIRQGLGKLGEHAAGKERGKSAASGRVRRFPKAS